MAAKGTLTPEVLHFLMAYEAMPVERLNQLMFTGTASVTVTAPPRACGAVLLQALDGSSCDLSAMVTL